MVSVSNSALISSACGPLNRAKTGWPGINVMRFFRGLVLSSTVSFARSASWQSARSESESRCAIVCCGRCDGVVCAIIQHSARAFCGVTT